MKLLTVALFLLLGAIQYPLWIGKGGWVRDLKQGLEAIEERARSELGMIRQDEIFFHLLDDKAARTASRSR
jgi:cell division protein FtsB